MKHVFSVVFIAFACVGLAKLMGESESAGLFGAIIAVGCYCTMVKGGE